MIISNQETKTQNEQLKTRKILGHNYGIFYAVQFVFW